MKGWSWRRLTPAQVMACDRQPDSQTLTEAAGIVAAVRADGDAALRRFGESFAEIGPGARLVLGRDVLDQALSRLPSDQRHLLRRTAARIADFAAAQRAAISEVEMAVPGGTAGHTIAAVARAGCYAPGGRYPLPSSVLMTAVTARAAGVERVLVASPRPAPITLAAAAVAGADALLTVGGAHAIAAMAYGSESVQACDVVVGPGNRWVTAAKKLVAGRVGIDMLAGPSELVVLADASADPQLIAADLLAQAEHDPEALPVLVATSGELIAAVTAALADQLTTLPTADIAIAALGNGFAVLADDYESAIAVCDHLAPEHLQVLVRHDQEVVPKLRHYGALFLGPASAEVLGDYGAGPNHTLPTGGGAGFSGGLSVLDFLRIRTWLHLAPGPASTALARDAAALARLEGLEAHARAAERRTSDADRPTK